MPKSITYNTFSIPGGINQKSDSQTFTSIKLNAVKNLKYKQSDSLSSIDAFRNIGTSKSLVNKEIINFERFNDTLLAFTPEEVHRLDSYDIDAKKHTFTKVGDYLNAEVDTNQIAQGGVNFYYPTMILHNKINYFAFTTGELITVIKYNLRNKTILDKRTYRETHTHLALQVNTAKNRTSNEEIVLYARLARNSLSLVKLTPYKTNSRFVPSNTHPDGSRAAAAQTVSTIQEGRRTKTFHNLRDWGKFTYNNENYKIIYSQNDAYFIINSKGVLICKIGTRTACSFDPRFMLSSESVIVDGDTIQIPCLLSTKEVSLKDPSLVAIGQEDLNNLLFFPAGLALITIKVDRKFKKINTVEYAGGLLMSGPLLQHYDGEKFNEFGFSEELNDFSIGSQFSNIKTIKTTMRYSNPDEVLYASRSGLRYITDSFSYMLSGNANYRFDRQTRRNDSSFLGIPNSYAQNERFRSNTIEINLDFDNPDGTLVVSESQVNGVFILYNRSTREIASVYAFSRLENPVHEAYDVFYEKILTNPNNISYPIEYGYFNIKGVSRSNLSPLADTIGQRNPGTAYGKLYIGPSSSSYSASVEDVADQESLKVSVRNDASSTTPPEPADLFRSITISSGSTAEKLSLRASSVSGNIRSWTISKGNFVFSQNNTYKLTFAHQPTREWVTLNVISQVDSVQPGNVPLPDIRTITIPEITTTAGGATKFTGPQINVNFNQAGSSIGDNRLAFEINSQGQSLIYSSRRNSGNSVIFSNNSNVISALSVNDKSSDIDVDFVLSDVNPQEESLLAKTETIYQYAGYFKWIDTLGKEHLSGLSFQKVKSVFGEIGDALVAGLDEKISIDLSFKNLNLTNKTNVFFILLRAKRPNAFYKIVTEVQINTYDEILHITDDFTEKDIFGAQVVNSLRRIYQPPGARFVAVGRRNKVFLGNVIGYEDSIFYSNSISNDSITNFVFQRFDPTNPNSDAGRIFMDNKILALSNMDTNLLIFTTRATFYLPVDTLIPQLIQESVANYASQSEGILPFNRGVCFVNNKGIQYVSRGFKVHWISVDIIKVLEGYKLNSINTELGVKVVSGYVSHNDRELRFRVVDSSNNPIGNLVFNTEFKVWTMEADLNGPEIEIKANRFISNNGQLFISQSINEQEGRPITRMREFSFETGWVNFSKVSQSALLKNIDFIGDFGNYSSFVTHVLYNYKEQIFPEYSHYIKSFAERQTADPSLRTSSVIRIQSKRQKIFSFKLKVRIISDNMKLSALGLIAKEQKIQQPHIRG